MDSCLRRNDIVLCLLSFPFDFAQDKFCGYEFFVGFVVFVVKLFVTKELRGIKSLGFGVDDKR